MNFYFGEMQKKLQHVVMDKRLCNSYFHQVEYRHQVDQKLLLLDQAGSRPRSQQSIQL